MIMHPCADLHELQYKVAYYLQLRENAVKGSAPAAGQGEEDPLPVPARPAHPRYRREGSGIRWRTAAREGPAVVVMRSVSHNTELCIVRGLRLLVGQSLLDLRRLSGSRC